MKLKIIAEIEIDQGTPLQVDRLVREKLSVYKNKWFFKEKFGILKQVEVIEARDDRGKALNHLETFFFDEPNDWLRYLAVEDILLISGFTSSTSGDNPYPVDLAILCNDTFYPAADAESITSINDLEEVAKMHLKDPIYGSTAWVMKKRKMYPLPKIAGKMREMGYNLEKLVKGK